jgi:major membrane immunogen (membrane-anchored lipoprotein)
VDRVKFAQEANSAAVLGMSDTERARSDAGRVSSEMLRNLKIGDNDDLGTAINKASNREFVRSFTSQLPDNERAELVTRTGELTQTGQRRIQAAIFNRTYDSPGLSDRIFESQDNEVKNVTNGLVASAARIGQAEELVRAGRRGDYSISGDVIAVTQKYADLRAKGQSVADYRQQGALFGRELTPNQERLLAVIEDNRRSGVKIRQVFENYADRVINSDDPNQGALFSGAKISREEFVSRWLDDIEGQQTQPQRQTSLF